MVNWPNLIEKGGYEKQDYTIDNYDVYARGDGDNRDVLLYDSRTGEGYRLRMS